VRLQSKEKVNKGESPAKTGKFNNMDDEKTLTYLYTFKFDDGHEKKFCIELDRQTLNIIQPEKPGYPDWVKLNYHKCPNCPLSEEANSLCPVAKNMVDLLENFLKSISYENVEVTIETKARKYMTRTSLQRALSSILGIYMVTGGCPILEKLKPMVYTHLPFATLEETKYRVISMYLLAQYFRSRKGKPPDWDLKELINVYNQVQKVNESFAKRMTHPEMEDANLNAISILDAFATFVPYSINKNILDEIEILFKAYLKE